MGTYAPLSYWSYCCSFMRALIALIELFGGPRTGTTARRYPKSHSTKPGPRRRLIPIMYWYPSCTRTAYYSVRHVESMSNSYCILFWIDVLNQRDHEYLKLSQDAIIPQSVSSRRGLETWTPS